MHREERRQKQEIEFVRDVLPVILIACTIVVFSSIPGNAMPIKPEWHMDKLGHAGVFAALGWFVARLVSRTGLSSRVVLLVLAGIGVSMWGALDEVHQLFVPGRVSDWRDWMADTAGGFFGAWGYLRLMLVRCWGHLPPNHGMTNIPNAPSRR